MEYYEVDKWKDMLYEFTLSREDVTIEYNFFKFKVRKQDVSKFRITFYKNVEIDTIDCESISIMSDVMLCDHSSVHDKIDKIKLCDIISVSIIVDKIIFSIERTE